MFTKDRAGSSACYEGCAEIWAPFTIQQATPSAADAAVRASLIGTVQRRDSSTQVTYAGHPLYLGGSCEAKGQDDQGFSGQWFLLSPSGDGIPAEGSWPGPQ